MPPRQIKRFVGSKSVMEENRTGDSRNRTSIRAERELKESLSRFQSLINNVHSGVALVDENGKFIIVNPAFLAMFGLSEDISQIKNLNDRNWGEWQVFEEDGTLLHVDEHPARKAAITRTPVKDKLVGVRLPSGGDLRWMLITAEPEFKPDSRINHLICTYHDVTERKRIETALRDSEQRIQMALSAGNSFSFEWDIYTDRVIRSQSCSEVLGLSGDEALYDTGQNFFQRIHPWDRQQFMELLGNLTPASSSYRTEYRVPRYDGTTVVLQETGRASFDMNGKMSRLSGVTVDITERKKAEEELKASEQRLRRIIDDSPIDIALMDLDGKFIDLNHAAVELHGFSSKNELIGRDCLSLIDPEYHRKALTEWNRVLETGSVQNIELVQLRKNGEKIDTLMSATRLNDASGVAYAVLAMVQDITERKKVHEALRRAKDELETRVRERTAELEQTATILGEEVADRRRAEKELQKAHESLAARAAQLRALAGELTITEQSERRRIAKVLHDHLQQLLVAAKFRVTILGRAGDELVGQGALEVQQLLDSAISTSRSLTAELSPPILHEAGLNAGLEWLSRWMADNHGLYVELMIDGDLPELEQDLRVLLFESIRELLFNAVKHAHVRQAKVNVRHLDQSELQIIVSDAGLGFDPTSMKKAGEEGGGFGLFSIRERLELFGGSLEITSSPGQGSRFTLRCPVKPGEASVEEVPIAVSAVPDKSYHVSAVKNGARIRVLIVDDHRVMREGLARLLGQEPDLEIAGEASDGELAVKLAQTLLPDVILMDLSMPKLSGIDATRAIHEKLPQIRIIGLSMFEEAERAQSMYEAGAFAYLAKTGPTEAVINAIRAAFPRTAPQA